MRLWCPLLVFKKDDIFPEALSTRRQLWKHHNNEPNILWVPEAAPTYSLSFCFMFWEISANKTWGTKWHFSSKVLDSGINHGFSPISTYVVGNTWAWVLFTIILIVLAQPIIQRVKILLE